jgi:hypothetical protein
MRLAQFICYDLTLRMQRDLQVNMLSWSYGQKRMALRDITWARLQIESQKGRRTVPSD